MQRSSGAFGGQTANAGIEECQGFTCALKVSPLEGIALFGCSVHSSSLATNGDA